MTSRRPLFTGDRLSCGEGACSRWVAQRPHAQTTRWVRITACTGLRLLRSRAVASYLATGWWDVWKSARCSLTAVDDITTTTVYRRPPLLWRGSLLPLGRAATPCPDNAVGQDHRVHRFTTAAQPSGSKLPRHGLVGCVQAQCEFPKCVGPLSLSVRSVPPRPLNQ
jgi:hypothetical protein